MELNERQLEAVEFGEGAMLILAGAGSGKTRVLVHRLARLIDQGHASPWELLAVTFTNKAARELTDRCRGMVGGIADRMWVGTFHGLAARILRRHADLIGYPRDYSIIDTDDQIRLIKDIVATLALDDSAFRADILRSMIDAAKNEARSPSAMAETHTDSFGTEVARIYATYQERLERMGSMDFGDLITNVIRLFREQPEVLASYQKRFRYVLVDEYQDTNHSQYLMVRALADGWGNLCVVGDDDQSIYGWRGADIRNILEFERDWPGAKVVRLEENYRSTGNIIDASAAVIANNSGRRGKRMFTRNAPGDPITIYTASDERDEARYIISEISALGERRGDAAVFYRTNAQSRAVEEELVRRKIPYVIVGATRFYERREIKDLIAYLRFAHNPDDDLSLERVLGVPARGIGKVTVERMRAVAAQERVSLWTALGSGKALSTIGAGPRGKITTFVEMASRWHDEEGSVAELLQRIIDEVGYYGWLESKPEDDPQDRIENVQELVGVARSFDELHSRIDEEDEGQGGTATNETRESDGTAPGEPDAIEDEPVLAPLAAFLEQLALASAVDDYDNRGRAVTLMTVHNSKGLEFDHVFIAGMEEGIFPHSRSIDDEGEGIEEERRLCYVGMTRARRRLVLTHARRRSVFGSSQFNFASRFLDELPSELVARQGSRVETSERSFGRMRPDHWADDHARDEVFDELPQARPLLTPGRYKAGMKVVHPMFGAGTVKRSDGTGEQEKLIVHFQRVGIKKLMARHARLEVV